METNGFDFRPNPAIPSHVIPNKKDAFSSFDHKYTSVIDFEPKSFRAVFISDIHLGTRGCKAEILSNFLTSITCEKLFLVGDIIDLWYMNKNNFYWPQSHNNVVRNILGKAKHGTQVNYILGNHDEAFRKWLDHSWILGHVSVANESEFITKNNKKMLVIHGDLFDTICNMNPWLYAIGDRSYEYVLKMNDFINKLRLRMGFHYWPLSRYLRERVKRAVMHVNDFEKHMSKFCKVKGFDGVICGHIHTPEIKDINGVMYMNDGDWVENCTALVENHDGSFEILNYSNHHENSLSHRRMEATN